MTYSVKEIFYTLQGEGFHAGRAAVFCRFSGCNLWSGREKDRSTAICKFCDTKFVGTNGATLPTNKIPETINLATNNKLEEFEIKSTRTYYWLLLLIPIYFLIKKK